MVSSSFVDRWYTAWMLRVVCVLCLFLAGCGPSLYVGYERPGYVVRGKGYLRGKGPLEIVFCHAVGDRARASQLEYRVKQLSRSRNCEPPAGSSTTSWLG